MMKNFYKIILAFILVFCLGFFLTYLTISSTLNNDTTEVQITELPTSILYKTTQVS